MATQTQKVSFKGLLDVGALLLFVCSIVSYLNGFLMFELVSHFQLQYLGASVLLSALFISLKHRKFLPFALLSTVLSAYQIVPFYLPHPQSGNQNGDNEITLLLSNVLATNTQYSKVLTLIETEAPDVVVLLEINEGWRMHIENLSKHYPYQITELRQDNFGIAVLSRHPSLDSEIIRMGELAIPSIEARYHIANKQIHLFATHPFPPTNATNLAYRNDQLKAVADWAKSRSAPKLILGDLNITPFSQDYRQLEEGTDLTNIRQGVGILPTWPAHIPFLQIPIDHILISSHFLVVSAETGPDIGSDHLPVIAKLQF